MRVGGIVHVDIRLYSRLSHNVLAITLCPKIQFLHKLPENGSRIIVGGTIERNLMSWSDPFLPLFFTQFLPQFYGVVWRCL